MTNEIYQQVQKNLLAKGINLTVTEITALDKFRWLWIAKAMKAPKYPSILMHNWGRFLLQKSRLKLLSTGKYQSPEKQEHYKQLLIQAETYQKNFKKCTSQETTTSPAQGIPLTPPS